MREGLTQYRRIQRINNAKNIAIIDNSIATLLKQTRQIASFIHYYNLQNETDEYFNQFIEKLTDIESIGAENFIPDGNMEPSQAVLFYFIKQLHALTSGFNDRWKHFLYWYINSVLQIKPIKQGNPKVCIKLTKNTNDLLKIDKGFGFIVKNNSATPLVYKLTDDIVMENTAIDEAIVVQFAKQKNIHPASAIDFVTSVGIFNIPADMEKELLFVDNNNQSTSKSLGFMISSPSLLLREGKRTVVIHLKLENDVLLLQYANQLENDKYLKDKVKLDAIKYLVTSNIFYIKISTVNGWEPIVDYLIKKEEKTLSIKFSLSEDFSATTQCSTDIHDIETNYPAIKIHLNADAWLYPYSWLKLILLRKIIIQTHVENINNVSVYNDLGKVDSSKPFTPFGINTEKGAWLTIGNYEIAVKNTKSIDVKINWEQLPSYNDGLYGYYREYYNNVNNQSFKVKASYLSDYQWKEISEYYLFNTLNSNGNPHAIAPLANQSSFLNIDIEKMPCTKEIEENYDYGIYTKTGFLNFSLCSPYMGFGEKYYRSIFSNYLMLPEKKKKIYGAPNEPISPLIERITLDYTSEDVIDIHARTIDNGFSFYHISPFGYHQIYPNNDYNSIPLIYTIDTDSNILLKLNNVKKGSILNLYFDFLSTNKKITKTQIPQIKWYIGKVYQWEPITEAFILEDNTRNLLVSGIIKLKVSDNLNDSLFNNNSIWLRIGIEKNEDVISNIKNIYLNVVEAELQFDEDNMEHEYSFIGDLEPEINIAGLSGFDVVAFFGGREKETEDDLLVRTSEFFSHRGKAITANDFEQLILQEFTDIKKVKCFANNGSVTLAVIPHKLDNDNNDNWKPKVTSRQLFKIENFISNYISARIKNINVINPFYEEVMVRCQLVFSTQHSTAACCAQLITLMNKTIAPWQQKYRSPKFDYTLSLNSIWMMIEKQTYIESIDSLSILLITSNKEEHYTINEYEGANVIVKPSTQYSIFVPAKEHIILTNSSSKFGINEMAINDSFII